MLVSYDMACKLFSYVGCTSEVMKTTVFVNTYQNNCQASESESVLSEENLSGWYFGRLFCCRRKTLL
jgi:hypothetical protein